MHKMQEKFAPGHGTCAGCGIPTIVRTVLGATEDPVVVINATGCLEVTSTLYPYTAWTVGYTPSIAVGVWAGNNDNHPMHIGAAGTYVAGPIWNKFMNQVLTSQPKENFIDYKPVSRNTPMISGDINLKKTVIYYNTKSGKEISESKAKKTDKDKVREEVKFEQHSLLYYLSKTSHIDPEMLKRWEEAVNPVSDKQD